MISPEPRIIWRKSTHSGSGGGQCTELAALGTSIGVRDSKNPFGPVLTFSRREMKHLFEEIRTS